MADMDFDRYDHVRPIRWEGDCLHLLDQRVLPFRVEYVECRDSRQVSEAIRALVVRGAPAIGIAAAYGVVLAGQGVDAADGKAALSRMTTAIEELNASRPTAVNITCRGARSTRTTPSSSSSLRTCVDSVGWLTWQASAARPKWSVSARVTR